MLIAKNELKIWGVYFMTLLFANFFHELGHCIPAWVHGYRAIPTLAKEYSSAAVPGFLTNSIAFGGVLNSVIFSVSDIAFYLKSSYKYGSSVLAGSLAMPAIYTLRFMFAGRGHDGTEFQEAQSAIGLSFEGHSADWLFIVIWLTGLTVWVKHSKPPVKILVRLIAGAIASIAFIVGLQIINNRIFDPIFS